MADYTLEDKRRALAALVFADGSARKAERLLADEGCEIPFTTIQTWKAQDPDEYQRLREQLVPVIEKHIAQEAEERAILAAQASRRILEALDADAIAAMKPKDLANAFKSVAVGEAVLIDKIQGPLRGRPNVIEHRHSAVDLLDKLASRIGSVIDSTAEPIEDVKELPA